MPKRHALGLATLCLALAALPACSSRTQVQRIDTASTVDLSGRWNDTDARLVSEEMVTDVLAHPWLTRYEVRNDERPAVIVGRIRNRSTEHIATETFTKDIERAFVNSGRVRVVASSGEREQLRDERSDQQDFSSPETVKQFGREHGADYMLIGTINSITDSDDGERVVFYQVDMELVDIETNEKVWIKDKEIKKYISRTKYKG